MATARIKDEGECWYHLVSRTAYQDYKFGNEAKSMFVEMMKRVAFFSGVEILNFCVMSNHFHILAHVLPRRELSDGELLARIEALYGFENAEEVRVHWDELRRRKWLHKLAKEQEAYTQRMWDVSNFMKCLKQRFSIWYRNHDRKFAGTLWEGRFRSVIVEDSPAALSAVSAYIDLNPVRAKIVDDPKDYKWSGYGAALSGDGAAMRGIARIFRPDATAGDFTASALATYREILYARGGDAIDGQTVKKVLKDGGKVPVPLLLRCRVRHFVKGVFFGSQEFVEGEFLKHRDRFLFGS
ncbi:MAG: transposase, partial [Kiritimatiellae bacterium]|nr:transposase [Kiritimatiellia bacterium]